MPKETKRLLTTKELCSKLQIHRHRLEKMVADGLPVAGRKATRGRPSWMFDPDAVAVWAAAAGRDIPAIAGEEIKQAVIEDVPAQVDTPPAPVDTPPSQQDTDAEPIALQLQAERSQYQKLFSRFLRTHAGDDAAGVAALAKAITLKSDALRRLELSVIEYQRKTGELVSVDLVTQKFYELASGTRERVMALPNELIPVLKPYLRDPDEVGQIKDIIDSAIRRALTVLPKSMPKLEVEK